jgi:3-oxoacyl-[acyl-carrier-protein] synthase II
MTTLDDTTAVRPGDAAVTGVGVTAPWGDDPRDETGAALDPGARARAAREDWFDVRTQLAPRGYKYLPPACQYLLAAARRAHVAAGSDLHGPDGSGLGVVIGTNRACSALHAAMDRVVLAGDADQLSPAMAPFFSVNVVAGRLSMEHPGRAFNLTLTSPAVAGLESVQVAARAMAAGRARAVLAGATEAAVEPGGTAAGRTEAGAVVLLLEPPESAAARGAPILGTCRSRALFVPPGRPDAAEAALSPVWEELAGRAAALSAVPAATLFGDGSPVADAVGRVLGRLTDRLSVSPLGAGCLGPTRRVAALLARGEGPALVVVAHRSGTVALTVVRPAASSAMAQDFASRRAEGSV